MEQKIINMESVQDYNDNLGVETLHPLVSVVDMSELPEIRHSLKRFGILLHLSETAGLWHHSIWPK